MMIIIAIALLSPNFAVKIWTTISSGEVVAKLYIISEFVIPKCPRSLLIAVSLP